MFDQLLSALSGSTSIPGPANTPAKALDPDDILKRITGAVERYAEWPPFSVGDLVTPRANSAMKGAGEPHAVVEILDDTGGRNSAVFVRSAQISPEQTYSNAYGRILNMRVIRSIDSHVAAHLVEAADFEAWTPEHEAAWREKLTKAAAGPQPMTLTEAVADLRDRAAGKEVRAEWKEGDTVEIVPDARGIEAPMAIEGLHVGIVRKVDPTDGTTHVLYHAASTGKAGTAWARNVDLKKWGPKPVEASAPSPADATA
ncbi:hypothetical protein [Methylobacterium sp. J-076]|uniref:hypothetical protein n=1 Tax=Methylobacterium sp. J-076 TaxID=2836655 RepID=UPI001FBA9FDD|nr:hypothetical protein [Methylobacterium sp. J-076]MCJ2015584.1 hypothetical protein [Methylobacterium sp. J-076]